MSADIVGSPEANGIKVARDEDACVVTMWGEVDASLRGVFGDVFAGVADDDGRVELDLGRVRFMDSAGLSYVIRLYVLGQGAGRDVVLRGVSEQVRELLEMTGMADRLPVVRSGER